MALIVCGLWGYNYVKSTGALLIPDKSTYTIDKTVTLSNLNDKLALGIDPMRYKLYIKFFAPDVSIQAGGFSASSGTTLETFLTETLKTPSYTDLTITIIPGWNMWDLDAYLASKDIGAPGDFLTTVQLNFAQYQKEFAFLEHVSSLEGFLYPDTYRIRKDGTADDAIRVMLREFDKQIGSEYTSLDPKKAYETLILASIVEREEPKKANQPIVAGILSKRVAEGIAMGADATVCYGYQKTQKQCTPSFIAQVIYEKNPYNTRNMLGYTPTPIAGFPVSTWKAALNPEASPYYYYLHDPTGQIHYAKTNAEHNQNKALYLK